MKMAVETPFGATHGPKLPTRSGVWPGWKKVSGRVYLAKGMATLGLGRGRRDVAVPLGWTWVAALVAR